MSIQNRIFKKTAGFSFFQIYIDTKTGNILDDFKDVLTADEIKKLVDINGVISMRPNSQILEQNQNSCFISEWYLKTSTINYQNTESKYLS
jgi:ribosomal protein L19E